MVFGLCRGLKQGMHVCMAMWMAWSCHCHFGRRQEVAMFWVGVWVMCGHKAKVLDRFKMAFNYCFKFN